MVFNQVQSHVNGTAHNVRVFAFIVFLAAIIVYFISAVVLLSDGVVNAKTGACCIRSSCNVHALPASVVAAWSTGGTCKYTAAEALQMGCPGSEADLDSCSVTNPQLCSINSSRSLLIAFGVIGIVLSVVLALSLVLRARHNAPLFFGGVGFSIVLSIVIIVIAGIAFHRQINDQHYTQQEAKQCTKRGCRYSKWYTFGSNACPVVDSHADVASWTLSPSSLKQPVSTLLFAPVAWIVLILLSLLLSIFCPRVANVALGSAEQSAVVVDDNNTLPAKNEQNETVELQGYPPQQAYTPSQQQGYTPGVTSVY